MSYLIYLLNLMKNKRKEFSKIYDQCIEKIYRFVFLKVGSQDIAQDLCSEAFLRGWEAFKSQEIDNPQAFLYRIARNLVTDHYREKGRAQFLSVDESYFPLIDHNEDLEQRMILSSDLEQVKSALSNLKEDYQNIVIWHYLEDISVPEIALMMDKTEEATRTLLHRALKSLRSNIKEA